MYPELFAELSRHFHNVAALEILAGPTASQFETSTNATVIGSETHDGGHAETMIENNSSGDVARLCSNAQRTEWVVSGFCMNLVEQQWEPGRDPARDPDIAAGGRCTNYRFDTTITVPAIGCRQKVIHGTPIFTLVIINP